MFESIQEAMRSLQRPERILCSPVQCCNVQQTSPALQTVEYITDTPPRFLWCYVGNTEGQICSKNHSRRPAQRVTIAEELTHNIQRFSTPTQEASSPKRMGVSATRSIGDERAQWSGLTAVYSCSACRQSFLNGTGHQALQGMFDFLTTSTVKHLFPSRYFIREDVHALLFQRFIFCFKSSWSN